MSDQHDHIESPSLIQPRTQWGRLLRPLERLAALALALPLLRSSLAHLGNPYFFLSTIYSYELTGIEIGKLVALFLPHLQIAVALCLLLRWWVIEAYALAFFLFSAFTLAQALTLIRGMSISSGCFGATESLHVGMRTILIASSGSVVAAVGWLITYTQGQSVTG